MVCLQNTSLVKIPILLFVYFVVCVKLQATVWQSCLINSGDSDGELEDNLDDLRNPALDQPPQYHTLQSNNVEISRDNPIATESTFNGTPGNNDETTDEIEDESTVHTNIYYGAPFLDQ